MPTSTTTLGAEHTTTAPLELCPCCEGCVLEDFLGGASQASDTFPMVGEAPAEGVNDQAERRLVARDDTYQAGDEFAQELELHLEDALDMDRQDRDARLEQARKRRLLPGADTTMSEFRSFFDDLSGTAYEYLAEVPRLASEEEPTIPSKVLQIRELTLRRLPHMGEALVRLITAAITVYRLRLTDLRLRELVLLWIIEGEQFMRCHDGNLYFFHLGAFAATGLSASSATHKEI